VADDVVVAVLVLRHRKNDKGVVEQVAVTLFNLVKRVDQAVGFILQFSLQYF